MKPSWRRRGRGRSSLNRETVECYRCHKIGHFSYECPSSKEANYAGFDEDDEVILTAEIDLDEDEHLEDHKENSFMAQTGKKGKDYLWFLDSGCSNHM
jgi:hypothetical protein